MITLKNTRIAFVVECLDDEDEIEEVEEFETEAAALAFIDSDECEEGEYIVSKIYIKE